MSIILVNYFLQNFGWIVLHYDVNSGSQVHVLSMKATSDKAVLIL